MNRRRKVFDKHLLGFELGESTQAAVTAKLGKPANTLAEEKVTVLEFADPPETSIATFKKVQFIFFEGVLLNVSYVQPEPKLSRAALRKILGQPDEELDADDEDDEDDGLSDLFDVTRDEEPMLSFAAHYDDDDNVEALSLCAELSEDEIDSDEGGDEESNG